jgi:multidrug efflux pump subunit AcrB
VKFSIPLFSTIVVFMGIALVGFSMARMLNLQLNPSRSLPSISVGFNWPGNGARVVEQEATSRPDVKECVIYS